MTVSLAKRACEQFRSASVDGCRGGGRKEVTLRMAEGRQRRGGGQPSGGWTDVNGRGGLCGGVGARRMEGDAAGSRAHGLVCRRT